MILISENDVNKISKISVQIRGMKSDEFRIIRGGAKISRNFRKTL